MEDVRLSAQESAMRRRTAHDAVASARLEGVELRREYLDQLERWMRGEITAKQLLRYVENH